MAMDSSDNLYIADAFNNRIRKVSPDGIITTVAGNGLDGFDGDGGPATSARLEFPMSVAVDTAGSLFVASAYRVRKMASDGIITSVAGNGTFGSSGDGGAPTSARLGYPLSIDVDSEGNLFISDSSNHRIRKVVFALTVPTLTSISPTFSGQGATVNVSLEGSSLFRPLAIDAGSSITISNIRVLSEVQATATFTHCIRRPSGRTQRQRHHEPWHKRQCFIHCHAAIPGCFDHQLPHREHGSWLQRNLCDWHRKCRQRGYYKCNDGNRHAARRFDFCFRNGDRMVLHRHQSRW